MSTALPRQFDGCDDAFEQFKNNAACLRRVHKQHSTFCMLTISEVGKAFGGRTLFSDVTLQVNRGDRIGLVGPNGAGKSTLFALILQKESPDAGTITFQRNTTVGFLPQESA